MFRLCLARQLTRRCIYFCAGGENNGYDLTDGGHLMAIKSQLPQGLATDSLWS